MSSLSDNFLSCGPCAWAALLMAMAGPCLAGEATTAPATRPVSGWAGRRVPVTGKAVKGLESFDELMVSFLATHDVPGGALAVTRNGKLVYARGFGYANCRPEAAGADGAKPELVQPDSLFRIASLSKPITAAAVMQLVDRGTWKLSDRVGKHMAWRPTSVKGSKPDPRLAEITLDQLLHHTGGWDRNKSGDPMGWSVRIAKAFGTASPPGPDLFVRYMQGQPLDFAPGSRVCYSNFGYCLLGRAIEAVTKQSYEEHVKKNVLAPLGIRRMRIGRTLAEGRAKGEVCYVSRRREKRPSVFDGRGPRRVPLPYGIWCLESMDAHGGWIASAGDLLRFARALDDPEHCPILSARSVKALWERPRGPLGLDKHGKPKAVYYARGWLVRHVGCGRINTWHTGGLAGTATLLVRRHDGLNWAVLFNTESDPRGQRLTRLIDPLVHVAADAVRRWPEHDLFAPRR